MGRPRRTALVAGLLVCLPVAVFGDVPAAAWRMADALAHQHDAAWVAHGTIPRAVRVHITGTVTEALHPGGAAPVRLALTNANPGPVLIRRVRVRIVRVRAPSADSAHPCGPADFAVRQMRRGVLRLPADRITDLAELGLPVASWPHVLMRDRPVNQDGCQGADLALVFRARRVLR